MEPLTPPHRRLNNIEGRQRLSVRCVHCNVHFEEEDVRKRTTLLFECPNCHTKSAVGDRSGLKTAAARLFLGGLATMVVFGGTTYVVISSTYAIDAWLYCILFTLWGLGLLIQSFSVYKVNVSPFVPLDSFEDESEEDGLHSCAICDV